MSRENLVVPPRFAGTPRPPTIEDGRDASQKPNQEIDMRIPKRRVGAGATLLAAATLALATTFTAPARAAIPFATDCFGNVVLTVGPIFGTSGDDVIYGTPGDDHIYAVDGNDTVYGMGGNDVICGGDGDDFLYAGSVPAESPPDAVHIDGEDGNDWIQGGEDNDVLYGGKGDDTISGFGGNDALHGQIGRDELRGGPGADYIECGDQKDSSTPTGDYADGGLETPPADPVLAASGCETVVNIP
jgi:hypothetical protein